MSLTTLFISAFAVALSGALMPGPLLTLTIASSLKKGFWQGPLIIIGHAALEVAMIAVILLGGSYVFEMAAVKKMIFAAGGIILIFIAVSLAKNNTGGDSRLNPKNYSSMIKENGLPAVFTGIIGSLSNPYWFIWWITIGTGLLLQAVEFKAKGVIVFFSGHILADLLWYSLVSFSFSKGKKIITEKIYRIVIYACSVFLLVLAVWFLLKIPAI